MDIATGYAALTSAFEIAKGLKNIDDRVKLNAAVIELQERILSAQQAATDAKDRLHEMEKTIEAFNSWTETAGRYALKDFGCQTYAYQARPETLSGEPPHLACPNCFRERRLSVLQYSDTYYGRKQKTRMASFSG
ncbi:hypothetical protein NKH36_23515 [Mesorhizobium sp. M1312]|uniref:hypothetical protein n=1 Tax=unclassified Mesorhizobium TaxID=325217 RepID=UPI00333B3B87